ncbi:MAG: Type 1 glutamine amidotransferase-like domain-containing protein, partial [Planctomycetota bacterium]|nr:Type 1 glutamine amidotransferase-like domain-containing protein [Planctomycetota bacterium]
EIAEILDGAGTLLVAGGHVGILYNRMRLFGVRDALPASTPVVGWSAGAMVLTDRILLFHDSPPQGPGDAEFLGPGLGMAPGVVVLPHASRRLDLAHRGRVALLARRLAPELVVALDDGDRLEAGADGWSGEGARRLTPAGAVVEEPMGAGA